MFYNIVYRYPAPPGLLAPRREQPRRAIQVSTFYTFMKMINHESNLT
jgi:hypothetical protein